MEPACLTEPGFCHNAIKDLILGSAQCSSFSVRRKKPSPSPSYLTERIWQSRELLQGRLKGYRIYPSIHPEVLLAVSEGICSSSR